MKGHIARAIKEKCLIHLLYEGRSRKVEGYALGRNDQGEEVLVCRQVDPWTPGEKCWQVLRLNAIYGLLVLDRPFEKADLTIPEHVLSGVERLADRLEPSSSIDPP